MIKIIDNIENNQSLSGFAIEFIHDLKFLIYSDQNGNIHKYDLQTMQYKMKFTKTSKEKVYN